MVTHGNRVKMKVVIETTECQSTLNRYFSLFLKSVALETFQAKSPKLVDHRRRNHALQTWYTASV